MGKTAFGKKLRNYRAQRGISAEWLAKKCGLSISTIRSIENGEHDPQPGTLFKICTATGIDIRKAGE